MTPIDFIGTNAFYAKDQPEYQPLPAFKTEDGVVVSCWRLTWWERVRLLFTGKVWLMQHTFNQPLQPQLPLIHSPVVYRSTDTVNHDA